MDDRPSVTAVVPALNAARTLEACLHAIAASDYPITELIVFDDGSTDRTSAIAQAAGARVTRNAGAPLGPGHGRNVASALARTELLLFVDADVILGRHALARLVGDITESGASAAFGSYDDQPAATGVSSLYANLRHHFVHQHGNRDASTFWAGIGLIDRKVFLEVGGYDAVRFRRPSIEDIELGVRLKAAGYGIRLVPEALGKHCKQWSLSQVWRTDIASRAYPWSCLIADNRTAGLDLNVSAGERATAACALAIPLLGIGAVFNPLFLLGVTLALGAYVYRTREFLAFLSRRMGPLALLGSVAMHWCYHVYASTTFAAVLVMTKLGLRRRSSVLERRSDSPPTASLLPERSQ